MHSSSSNVYRSVSTDPSNGKVPVYPNTGSFPASASTGDLAIDVSTGILYEWFSSAWTAIAYPSSSAPYVLKAGDTMTGSLTITAPTGLAARFGSSTRYANFTSDASFISLTASGTQHLRIPGFVWEDTNTFWSYVSTPSVGIRHSDGAGNVAQFFERYSSGGRFGVYTGSPTAQIQVHSSGASVIASILRGATSQSANLTEWQNSSSTVLSSVDSSGKFAIGTSSASAWLDINPTNSTTRAMHIGRATGSQVTPFYITPYNATSTPDMFIDWKGNICVHTGTLDATANYPLNIAPTTATSNTAPIVADFLNPYSGVTSSGIGAAFQFSATNSNANLRTVANLSGFFTTTTQGSEASAWTFNLYKGDGATGVTSVEVARMTSAGYLGVGTASPAEFLDVSGNINLTGILYRTGLGGKRNILFTSGNNEVFELHDSSGTAKAQFKASGSSYFIGGSLGIGTSSPSATLHATPTSSLTTGTINGVLIDPTWSPAAGSGVFKALSIQYTNSASGAQSGRSTGLEINRATSGTSFTTEYLIDLQNNAASRFRTLIDGEVQFINATGRFFQATGAGAFIYGDGSSNHTRLDSTGFTVGDGTAPSGFKFKVTGTTAANIVAIIKGATSQSGNLTEWQNSAGSILSKIDSSGNITAGVHYVNASNFMDVSTGLRLRSNSSGIEFWPNGSKSGVFGTTGFYVGTGTIDASAILQADSVTQGFLPPKMNTGQRNSITSPAEGLIIYNTDNKCHEGYDGTTWNRFY
jgi:hypothetical protein